ncbi:MAG: SurA N-terminal domain-containing protein [Flavobacteriaceae bacterium]|jgi:peptidyl-prolyl cis-trans isomerase D|nr:SurA N-terminal domain-containing protein [Flavobacteriaceae bacterium]
MAILNKIRQRSMVLIIVIAMALFSFVLTDLFKNSSLFGSGPSTTIGEINGIKISQIDFAQQVENRQRQMGPNSSSVQVINAVWDQELRSAIFQSIGEDLDMQVGRKELIDLIKQSLGGYEEFLDDTGNFSEAKLNGFIANLKQISPEFSFLGGTPIDYKSWTVFEKNLTQGALQTNYFNLVASGLFATLNEGMVMHQAENEEADIKFVQIPFSSIADSLVEPTNDDVKSFIKMHEKEYTVDASRGVQFVVFEEKPSKADEDQVKAKLNELLDNRVVFNEATQSQDTVLGFKNTREVGGFLASNSAFAFNDQFLVKSELPLNLADSLYSLEKNDIYGPYIQEGYYVATKLIDAAQKPDSVKVRHILIPFVGGQRADASVTKTDAEAKVTADSILGLIKTKKSKFTDLLSLSSDVVSNEKEGVIDWFTFNAGMAEEFKDFSFDNPKGSIDVVRTDFGYHVIEILDQGGSQKLIKLANLALPIEPSEETIDSVFNATSKFEIAIENQDFAKVVKDNSYTLRPVSGLRILDENIPGLGVQRSVVKWAFDKETKLGSVRRFNLNTGGYVVAQLTEVTEEGLMPLDKAIVRARGQIMKNKKAEIIRKRALATNLESLAAAEGQAVKTANQLKLTNPLLSGVGREPKIVGAAFALKDGETTGLLQGENGLYMVQMVKKTPAPVLESYLSYATRIRQTRVGNVNTEAFNALKAAADIEDNRSDFY